MACIFRFELCCYISFCLLGLFGFACVEGSRAAPNFEGLKSEIHVRRLKKDLIISEYIEGTGNNKAIEIYNGTNDVVDLEAYHLRFYFQGKSKPGTSIQLKGALLPGQVHVVAQERSEPALLKVADQFDAKAWYNGNDAVELVYLPFDQVNDQEQNQGRDQKYDQDQSEVQVVDVIGQIGHDPGNSWGVVMTSTIDCTLRRRSTVVLGDQNGLDFFDPSEQWTGYAVDDFRGLGHHEMETESPDNKDDVNRFYIHEVQSAQDRSPYVDTWVKVEGVVVAAFQKKHQIGGFFVQEEDVDADGDSSTSEGIFVEDRMTKVRVGDRVEVVAQVAERFERTTLRDARVSLLSHSNPLPTPAMIRMPFASLKSPENVEGMRVSLPQTLTISETRDLGRYGQFLVSMGRLRQPTNDVSPGAKAREMQELNDRNRLWIDDGSIEQYPDPIAFPGFEMCGEMTLRAGYRVIGAVGILDHNFGSFRLLPTEPLTISSVENHRSIGVELQPSRLRVASYNVFNYFNGDGQGKGFPSTRGARSHQAFLRQRKKVISAIRALDADIVALMEVENDGYGSESAIADLVNGLNERQERQNYAFVDPQYKQIGDDEIAVALIYRPHKVFPTGVSAILDRRVDSQFNDRENRPSLAQSFVELATGQRLTVVANHFKSKGSSCANIGDPDLEDGQGNCSHTRRQAAQALVKWIESDPTASGDSDVLLLGDFNAYAKEDPIVHMLKAGFRDQIDRFVGYNRAYSYVFDGQSGYLDHALASPSMSAQVVDAAHWHSNADEPTVLDYRELFKSTEQLSSFFDTDAYRASDHDPVVVAINLKSTYED